MSENSVIREFDDGVLLLTLNRPEKKNAFNMSQWNAFSDALNAAREDDSVAAVVVTGAGQDFSAGQDLSDFSTAFAEGSDVDPGAGYQSTMDALFSLDKPLIAAAKGIGVGIGATLLFACDIVYVGQSVRLKLPFVSLGLVPEAASSYTLPHAIGSQRAAELFYTAEWIDAERALEVGVAARVYPDDELLAAALEKAKMIAKHPVSALRATKQTLMAPHRDAIKAARAAEDAGMVAQAGSPANIEAIKAFLEKRPPNFRNLRERAEEE